MSRETYEFSKSALRDGVRKFFDGDQEQAAWYGVRRKWALAKDTKKNEIIKAAKEEGKALPKSFEPKVAYEPLFPDRKFTIPKEARPKAEPKAEPKAKPAPKPKAKPAPKPKAKPAPKPKAVKATGTAAKLAKPKAEPKPKPKEPEVKGTAKPPVAVADTAKPPVAVADTGGVKELPSTPTSDVTDETLAKYVKDNPKAKASDLIGKFHVSFNRAKAAVDAAKAPRV